MGKITDLNVIKRERSAFASHMGDANEFIVTGILMRLGFDVHVSSVKSGAYDLIIAAYTDFEKKETKFIRVQVKTGAGSASFMAGGRGGIDREYKSDVKTYKYTTEHNDLFIAIDRDTLDLYLIPTQFLEMWGKSKAFSKLKILRNNWDILLNWNEEYLNELRKKLSNDKFTKRLFGWLPQLSIGGV